MSDKQQRESEPSADDRKRRGSFFAVGFVCLLIYILSPIPVRLCLTKLGIDEFANRGFGVFYAPLRYLDANVPIVHRFYAWQIQLFGL